jgi:hypothetical protein
LFEPPQAAYHDWMANGPESPPEGGGDPDVIRLDLRWILPIGGLAAIIFTIIFLELCGREDVDEAVTAPEPVDTATAQTPAGTSTPGPSPTAGAATATTVSEPGEDQRDVTRQQDLAAIAAALTQYEGDNGSFPTTDGNVQSLCAFENDGGCELSEVLDPIPGDPLGDPGTNGYWYRSDGATYTLWAQRETDQGEECADHPDHLEDFDSLYCLSG